MSLHHYQPNIPTNSEVSLTRVLVKHSLPLVNIGIKRALQTHSDFEVVGEEASWSISSVILTDLASAMHAQSSTHGHHKVIVVSHRVREHEIGQALNRGVAGYLRQDCLPAVLVDCVRQVARGGRYLPDDVKASLANAPVREALTRREREVLIGMVQGGSNKRIASDLGIGVETVKRHMKAVLSKLDASTRTEAAAHAQMRGLV